jgi:hypothetical protein
MFFNPWKKYEGSIMNVNQYVRRRILHLGIVLLLLCADSARAADVGETATLSVKPAKCIALHKGQKCYQRLTFTFESSIIGQYCLYQVPLVKPLHCWDAGEREQPVIEFESDKSEVYQVRRPSEAMVLAEVKVRLASVYQQSKKSYSGWRLF